MSELVSKAMTAPRLQITSMVLYSDAIEMTSPLGKSVGGGGREAVASGASEVEESVFVASTGDGSNEGE